MRKILFLGLVLPLVLGSCQLKEEFVFEKNGSGNYSVGMDMSEVMAAAKEGMDSTAQESRVARDTTVHFADILDERKDSIKLLPAKDQRNLELLRPMKFGYVEDEAAGKMEFALDMPFKNLDNLTEMFTAMGELDGEYLGEMVSKGGGKPKEKKKDGDDDFLQMGQSYTTHFSKKNFSRKMTEKARQEFIAQKDSIFGGEMGQFMDMLQIKQVYRFPYKVKSVSNPNAKIGSDFKSVEVTGPLKKMKEELEYFDIEVEFER
ncbi:hypothetical protein [Sediminicola luteus]|nr:hypothetical protein [Sediminicola luteus]